MIVAQGGVTGGRSLYVKGGKPKYCYNFFGLERYYVEGTEAIPPGQHQVRMEFTYDGGGVGKGGTVTLYIDGVAGRQRTHRADRGRSCSPPTRPATSATSSARRSRTDYGVNASSPARSNWVEIDLGLDDHNHMIKPEDRVSVAMGDPVRASRCAGRTTRLPACSFASRGVVMSMRLPLPRRRSSASGPVVPRRRSPRRPSGPSRSRTTGC